MVTAEGGAADFLGRGSVTDDFVDHFRGNDGGFDYSWEERWIRDEGIVKLVPPAVKRALAAAGVAPADVAHFCFPSTFSGMAATLAKSLGIPAEAVRDNLAAVMGEAGSAHGPLMLAHALEQAKAGEIIVVAQFGQGAEALVFRATGAANLKPARGVAGSLAQPRPPSGLARPTPPAGWRTWCWPIPTCTITVASWAASKPVRSRWAML